MIEPRMSIPDEPIAYRGRVSKGCMNVRRRRTYNETLANDIGSEVVARCAHDEALTHNISRQRIAERD